MLCAVWETQGLQHLLLLWADCSVSAQAAARRFQLLGGAACRHKPGMQQTSHDVSTVLDSVHANCYHIAHPDKTLLKVRPSRPPALAVPLGNFNTTLTASLVVSAHC
jgi:hypothetical protein